MSTPQESWRSIQTSFTAAPIFSTLSSDLFSLVAMGKADRVASLLDERPSLANSVRHDETALLYLPTWDEDVALQMAELLLSRGADPRFKNKAGRTAADEAERNGMDAVADLLRSASAAS